MYETLMRPRRHSLKKKQPLSELDLPELLASLRADQEESLRRSNRLQTSTTDCAPSPISSNSDSAARLSFIARLTRAASEWLERYRAAKEKAWRESPAGQAESKRQYREDIEREIKPWICVDDLTRRNVPWSEFDADYQEFKNLFQRDRDIFEALMAKVQPGDEIASFSTHEETWKRMFGRGGWAIVRDGKVVAQLVTIMN